MADTKPAVGDFLVCADTGLLFVVTADCGGNIIAVHKARKDGKPDMRWSGLSTTWDSVMWRREADRA